MPVYMAWNVFCFLAFWKSSSIIPVYNKKLQKAIINSESLKYLKSLGLSSDKRYGFRSSRSIIGLLKIIAEIVCQVLDKNGWARTVALSLSKAFEIIWYKGLCTKLKGYIIFWTNLRNDSIFFIKSRNECCIERPLLKIVLHKYRYDIPNGLSSQLAIYTDDPTIYYCQ